MTETTTAEKRASGIFTNNQPPDKKKAFRASRAPMLSESMIETGSTISGKIVDISIPKDSKFKRPIITIEQESGMVLQVPSWASIMNTIDPDQIGAKAWKEVEGHTLWVTKMGTKKNPTTGRDFQVFDVVIV